MNKSYRIFEPVKTKAEKIDISKYAGESLRIAFGGMKGYRYAVIYFTDRVEVQRVAENAEEFMVEDFAKLLELRIFGPKSEYYCIRTEDGWKGRIRVDMETDSAQNSDSDGYEEQESFDELHKIWNRVHKQLDADGELLFLRVRNYFTGKGELRSVDSRFVDFECRSCRECEEEFKDA